jgi:hypothetical protein
MDNEITADTAGFLAGERLRLIASAVRGHMVAFLLDQPLLTNRYDVDADSCHTESLRTARLQSLHRWSAEFR